MDNPRAEKVAVVTEVRERFERSSAAILTEYRGLTVKDLAALRRTLRDAGSEYKIYKNTLVRFAAADLGLDGLNDLLTGPTAIAFVDGDAASVAKALRDYAKANPKLTVKGGVLGTRVISVADATSLADLPPREVVLARLAGALAAPMRTFAGLLEAVPRSFAYGLKALIEKRGGVPDRPEGAEPELGGEASGGREMSPGDTSSAPEPEAEAVEASVTEAGTGTGEVDLGEARDDERTEVAPAATTPEVAPAATTPEVAPAATTPEPSPPALPPESDSEPAEEVVAASVAEAVPEPPPPDAAPHAAGEPAIAPIPDPEAAEVEPLAAHAIPAEVGPEIGSVEPEPVTEATRADGPGDDTPPAGNATPDRGTPAAD